jgi:hypothetical protein
MSLSFLSNYINTEIINIFHFNYSKIYKLNPFVIVTTNASLITNIVINIQIFIMIFLLSPLIWLLAIINILLLSLDQLKSHFFSDNYTNDVMIKNINENVVTKVRKTIEKYVINNVYLKMKVSFGDLFILNTLFITYFYDIVLFGSLIALIIFYDVHILFEYMKAIMLLFILFPNIALNIAIDIMMYVHILLNITMLDYIINNLLYPLNTEDDKDHNDIITLTESSSKKYNLFLIKRLFMLPFSVIYYLLKGFINVTSITFFGKILFDVTTLSLSSQFNKELTFFDNMIFNAMMITTFFMKEKKLNNTL